MGSVQGLKTIVILADGMADYPVPELQGKTPLMVASKPGIDEIARKGQTGLFQTIGPDMGTGSAVANLVVLGYNPRTDYTGRGVLEAASLGISVQPEDLVLRMNLIAVEDGKIRSHSSGHISTEEARILIEDLNAHFHSHPLRLYPGLSYRHIGIIPGANEHLNCAEPHDHVGEPITELMAKPLEPSAKPTAEFLNWITEESQAFLVSHPVNIQRKKEGKLPANCLWPWSPGKRPNMASFESKWGIKGAVISAVDLIKGIAIYAGMDVIPVEGATGLYDTNYEGKADAGLKALEDHDFVYIHVEAPDEAGHDRDLHLKIQCIEDLDRRLVQRVLQGIHAYYPKTCIAILPDHRTPVTIGAHVRDLVPVAIYDPRENPDGVEQFDEESVKQGALGIIKGDQFIKTVLRRLKLT